jgi:hypothetical protein
MAVIDPVQNVVTVQGNDITVDMNKCAERERCSARGLVGLMIAESGLSETARRPVDPADDLRYWPDVSGSVGQQTVLYAKGYGLGDGTASRSNIDDVMHILMTNIPLAINIAARQYGSYYRLTGDHFEACARYNGGPGASWASIPPGNRKNYLDGWAASAQYLTGDQPEQPDDWAPVDVRDRYPFAPGNGVYPPRELGDIQQVVYHHGDSALPNPDQASELAMLDDYYQLHIKRDGVHGWPSIGYHLAVGSSGNVYYLNGLDLISYHAGNWPINVHGIGIVFIGNFTDDPPPHIMIQAAIQARRWAAQQCGLGDLPYSGHKDWYGTACPGNWWPSQRGLLSETEDPAVIAELQAKVAEQDSYIGALTHDVIGGAANLIEQAKQTLPADPELLDKALALLNENKS